MTFPMWGIVCFECEVTYTHDLDIDKGRATLMGRKKDWLRTARGSGHFPLTYNFPLERNDHVIQCSYCGKWVAEKLITRDHVYPKSKGGIIKAPSCEPCNIEKTDMKPIEWAIYCYKTRRDIALVPIGFDIVDTPKVQEVYKGAIERIRQGKWIVDPVKGIIKTKRGRTLGTKSRSGNINIAMNYLGKTRPMPVHNLIWMYVNGYLPEGAVINHTNNDKSDNKIDNLQIIMRSE